MQRKSFPMITRLPSPKGQKEHKPKTVSGSPFHSFIQFIHSSIASTSLQTLSKKKLTINEVTERHEWLNNYYGMWRWHVGGQTPLPPFFRLYHGCLWYLVGPSVHPSVWRILVGWLNFSCWLPILEIPGILFVSSEYRKF